MSKKVNCFLLLCLLKFVFSHDDGGYWVENKGKVVQKREETVTTGLPEVVSSPKGGEAAGSAPPAEGGETTARPKGRGRGRRPGGGGGGAAAAVDTAAMANLLKVLFGGKKK